MEQFIHILKNALEYYDENTIKYYDKKKSFRDFHIDQENNIITFFNKKGNKIYESKYTVIGKYIIDSQLWIWGWANPKLSKSSIITSINVLNYAFGLDEPHLSLKTALINSRFQIVSSIQVDMLVALTCFLSKQPFVISLYGRSKVNSVIYITLNNK